MSPDDSRRRRVPPLPPHERRAALIAATIPLLREHGLTVNTRQIAQAANVAEGTIFTVFPHKQSLIEAAIITAFDPTPIERGIKEIDQTLDLRERFYAIAEIVSRRLAENANLMLSIRKSTKTSHHHEYKESHENLRTELQHVRQRLLAAVTASIEHDHSGLRHDPSTTAYLFLSMLVMNEHTLLGSFQRLQTHEIVTLFLDGILAHQTRDHIASEESSPC